MKNLRNLRARIARLDALAEKANAPTFDEYLVATGRETARRLRGAFGRLACIPSLDGLPASHHGPLWRVQNLLADDTPEQAAADRRVVEAWERAHGKADIRSHAEQVRATLLDMKPKDTR